MSKKDGIVLNRQNTRVYRRELLKLSPKEVIKQCKAQKIAVSGSKADMVTKLVSKQRSSLKKNTSNTPNTPKKPKTPTKKEKKESKITT